MNQETKGIICLLLSSFFFAVMGAAVKSTPTIPIAQKIFFRNLVGVIITGIILIRDKENLIGSNIRLLTLRSIFGLLGVAANFYAISKLPLSDAALLNRMSPFFVILLSLVFLKEHVVKYQIYSMLIALLGASFIIKPQFDYTIIPALIGLLSASFAAAGYTCVRQLRIYSSPYKIVFFFCMFSCLTAIPFMLIGDFNYPNSKEFALLLLIGLSATAAQIFMTTGYKFAPASRLAIYGYANILFSAVLGIIIWGEFPDLLSVTGGIMIILGGLINYIAINNRTKLQ
ncbi:DMT family transporter [Paramaledivibacter caminithermalis]|jgi:drug/metabolite transporter (DMT)-like permease|uniref:Permease of the drug/metabolite transporter (DMT) superfamily n=1 Tax=Paramaledivibacter caminithermalis (strain DSM 15212 / CIP 107654 / DViRD3) TaxID=1121301 RepID=A0A1M6QLK8_PARC5|nr:DMT family transporter [Paramaledivibacter caminithermalis]SHK21169.1 Permease of the drug/metabolite transporter (DMT) superfamily [Paramaledivibacter caminithermalis DSM 15212]